MNMTGPWRITFDTNPDHCNFSCIMCEDHSPFSKTQTNRIKSGLPRRRMPIELIRKTVAEAKTMGLKEIIPSTMGEPLLYKKFPEIIAICHDYGIKMNLTTNGSFPIKGVQEWAKLIVPVTSDVKISWNGATKTTHEKIMLGSHWETVLNNVREFIAIRNAFAENNKNYCRVTFQLTFLEENIQELADIVALGIELGIDRIKGHHLWVHFDEMSESSMRRNPEAIARWNAAVLQAQTIAAQKKLANGKSILLENIYPLTITKNFHTLAGTCPFLNKEAWVATDGRFNPCCAPDQERRKLGEFGNLNETTLSEIWHSANYLNLQKNYQNHPICQKCNMRKTGNT